MAVRLLKNSWWVDFQFNRRRYRRRSPENTRQGARAYEMLLLQRLARGETIDGPGPGLSPSFEKFAWRWFDEYVVPNNRFSEQSADSARCRPPFRNDLAHRSDLMSLT